MRGLNTLWSGSNMLRRYVATWRWSSIMSLHSYKGRRFWCGALPSTSCFHSSAILSKSRDKQSKAKGKQLPYNLEMNDPQSLVSEEYLDMSSLLGKMKALQEELTDQLVANFSNRVDLRRYETVTFEVDHGELGKETTLVNRVAMVSMKNPNQIAVDFSRNPSVMKAAKLAIDKQLQVNSQASGAILHIQVPLMTRDRREQLSHNVKDVLNDYKHSVNVVYSEFDKKIMKLSKQPDEARAARQILLSVKKAFEAKGEQLVKAKQEALLKEQL